MQTTHTVLLPLSSEAPQPENFQETVILPRITEDMNSARFSGIPEANSQHRHTDFLKRLGGSVLAVSPVAKRYGAHSEAHGFRPAAEIIAEVTRDAEIRRTEAAYRRLFRDEQVRPRTPDGWPIKPDLLTHGQESGVNAAFQVFSQENQAARPSMPSKSPDRQF